MDQAQQAQCLGHSNAHFRSNADCIPSMMSRDLLEWLGSNVILVSTLTSSVTWTRMSFLFLDLRVMSLQRWNMVFPPRKERTQQHITLTKLWVTPSIPPFVLICQIEVSRYTSLLRFSSVIYLLKTTPVKSLDFLDEGFFFPHPAVKEKSTDSSSVCLGSCQNDLSRSGDRNVGIDFLLYTPVM